MCVCRLGKKPTKLVNLSYGCGLKSALWKWRWFAWVIEENVLPWFKCQGHRGALRPTSGIRRISVYRIPYSTAGRLDRVRTKQMWLTCTEASTSWTTEESRRHRKNLTQRMSLSVYKLAILGRVLLKSSEYTPEKSVSVIRMSLKVKGDPIEQRWPVDWTHIKYRAERLRKDSKFPSPAKSIDLSKAKMTS